MKRLVWTGIALVLGIAVISAVSLTHAGGARAPITQVAPLPGGVTRILSAQPFVLDRAWQHVWRVEQPSFDAGWLVVLEVDPALVVPRQVEEPVLYAGDQTVERINVRQQSGHVVAIIPSKRDERGNVALDLAVTPLYFGAAMLPERVTAARASEELAHAKAIGVMPLAVPVLQPLLHLPSRDELQERTALLVLEHAPDEADLGLGLLAPRINK